MIKRIATIALLAVFVCAFTGCSDRETAAGTQTDTISPATPPAVADDPSETAATQTVEIGEDRSPAEGGVLAESEPASTPTPSPSPSPGPSN